MHHIIRLGTHAEKVYLDRAAPWFDETLLNANLVEATASATALFLFQLGKYYFIDPVTYAFALDPLYIQSRDTDGQLRFKRTFKKLAFRYGLIDQEDAPVPRLGPDDLSDPARLRDFCQRVLTYQATRCEEALQQDAEFLQETAAVRPVRLLAPYFYSAHDPDWRRLNGHLIEQACDLAGQVPVWGVICLDALVLDQYELVAEVADFYSRLPCSGLCLWLTNLDEPSATATQLNGLRRLVSQLVTAGKADLINLYGGYFSALLRFDGLTGFSHGVGYGERRDIVPVLGGGLPPAKYYLPPIHEEIYIEELLRLAAAFDSDDFSTQICSCAICRGLLRVSLEHLLEEYSRTVRKALRGVYRDFPDPIVYRYTRFHFLHNRHMELAWLDGHDRAQAIGELRDASAHFTHLLTPNHIRHLQTWAATLDSPLT
jgi:hypothetical protein